MGGNTACCMDYPEVQVEAPVVFPDFEHMFIGEYAPLDDKNIAQDKLQEQW